MARLTYAVPFALAVAALAGACGNKNSSTNADAPVISLTDAKPPVDAMPDALVCTLPEKQCTPGMCTNINTDPNNCTDCGMQCKGGAFCDKGCACPTPANFLPADRKAEMTGTDMFIPIAQINVNIGAAPIVGATANDPNNLFAAIVGTGTANMTVTGKDYTLTAPSFPPTANTILAAYGFSGQSAQATYAATSGTVNFSKVCANEIAGTLTNVTFQGVKGDITKLMFQVDPNGCSFTAAKMTFDIKQGAGC